MAEERLPWERWLELAALIRSLWPSSDFPDDTIREWYERGGWRWDFDWTQGAIVRHLEESMHAPSFADLAAGRRALIDAHRREQDASRRRGERQRTPQEVAEITARRDAWRRVQAAMSSEHYGREVKAAVGEAIGSPESNWNGRAPAYDERVRRWSELEPSWGPGEAPGILARLLELVQRCEAEHAPPPLVAGVPAGVLSEWE